jgi:hypothetical protein
MAAASVSHQEWEKNQLRSHLFINYFRNSTNLRHLLRDSNNEDNEMNKGIPGIQHKRAGFGIQRYIDFYISILGL